MTMQELFTHPPVEYRQAPFWFWNHGLDRHTLRWQIAQLHDKGLGGFVMHARHGLLTPYLSEAWMDCIRLGCDEARKHGMLAWAYDERDWPSGPAGGLTLQIPDHRLHYLRMESLDLDGPAELELGADTVAAYIERGCSRPGCCNGDPQPLSLIPGKGGKIRIPEGAHRLLKAVQFECPAILWFESYLDTLNPDACQSFLRSTYDYHEEKLGDLKALGLAGFFTDEPALSTYPDDYARIPWTATLPETFYRAKGYDLIGRLPEFFAPGDAGAQVRFDYWDVATSMFEQAYFRQISGWCAKRGLQMIGHPLGEEPLLYQFRCLGTIFKYLKHQHMPGMDHLTVTTGKNHPVSMSPKMVVSAALLAGRERIMTETFGESGWGLTLREMKWMADWQMVHGINYFIPHAFYYSIARRRKKDSPPSEFYQAPHWPYYRNFADYTARVTAAITGGEHIAKIALFYPMTSIWADFAPGQNVPDSVMEIEKAFAPLGEMLLQMHRDFVVVDEESLANASIKDGMLSVNGLSFSALVLPPLTTLRQSTVPVIRKMAEQGVVVAVGARPWRILDGAPGETLLPGDIPELRQIPRDDLSALDSALESITPDVTINGAPDVYYLHRRKEGKEIFFFANTGKESVDAAVSLETVGAAEIWDPESGEIYPAPIQDSVDGRLRISLPLDMAGSCLLVVNPAQAPVPTVREEFIPTCRIAICPDIWHFTPYNGNFLALKDWRLSMDNRHKVTELHYTTDFVLTEHIANLRLLLDGVPEHPYGIPEAARPLVADETYTVISLDGTPLTKTAHWEIDPKFRVVDMNNTEPGRHRLEITIRNHGWFPQPGLEEYVWLAGDFMIDKTDGLPHLCPCRGVKAGAWESQGYPFFSGTAAYAASFDVPADATGQRMFLSAGRVGNILEVEVNGKTAGVRAWPPYRVDVSSLIWPGRPNLVILKVTNTLRNLLEGPDPERPSGLLDTVWLEIGE